MCFQTWQSINHLYDQHTAGVKDDGGVVGLTESESESESFYSVLLQTQETSAKTNLVAVAEATWKKCIHECMYVKVKLVNTSKS